MPRTSCGAFLASNMLARRGVSNLLESVVFRVSKTGKGRHGEHTRMGCRGSSLPTGQHDMHQRRGIFRTDRRIAGQRWEDFFDAAAISAVTVTAELDVAETATGAEQVVRHMGDHCQLFRAGRHRLVVGTGWQGFQVAGDGQQIVIADMLRAVHDDVGHIARSRCIAVLPCLEEEFGILDRP